jgi:hypothetical protein
MKKTTGEPHDRLTRMGNEVLEAILVHPEYKPGVKAIVFLHDDGMAGIGLQGYDEDLTEAVVDLFVHLKAMFAAMGKELSLFPIEPNDPSTS